MCLQTAMRYVISTEILSVFEHQGSRVQYVCYYCKYDTTINQDWVGKH